MFALTAALSTILAVDNLRKCSLMIVDCYCMCNSNGESVDYLIVKNKKFFYIIHWKGSCSHLCYSIWGLSGSYLDNDLVVGMMARNVSFRRRLKIWNILRCVCWPFGDRGTVGLLIVNFIWMKIRYLNMSAFLCILRLYKI